MDVEIVNIADIRVEESTLRQLRNAGVDVDSNGLAMAALAAARKLDGGIGARDMAAVMRELRAALDTLTKDVVPVRRSSVDELRRRREERRRQGGE